MLDAQYSKITSRYLIVIAMTYAACLFTIFVNRGPCLDEFWTMWMTDPHLSLKYAYQRRWSTDLHPPLYYFLTWLLRHITNDNFTYVRLINIFPFVIFIPTLVLWKKYCGIGPWLATFLTVLVSSPFFLANSVDLRSYYSLTVLGACLVMLTRIGRSIPAVSILDNKWLIFVTVVTILISLNLHYSASLVYLWVISVEIIKSMRDRNFRWVVILSATTFIAGLILLWCLWHTFKTVPNFSYLNTAPSRSAKFIIAGVALSTLPNLGINLAILLSFVRRRSVNVSIWAWSLATLGIAALALFFQSLLNHAMGLNYVMDLIPIGSAFIADIVSGFIFSDGLLVILMGLSAISSQYITAYHELENKRWLLYSNIFRDIKHLCPSAQFVGVDQNSLPEFAHHPLVSGWIGVFPEGYAEVGRLSNVEFIVTSATNYTDITLDKCPLMLLSDHEVTPTRLSMPDLLREAKISIKNYRYFTAYGHDYQRLFVFYP